MFDLGFCFTSLKAAQAGLSIYTHNIPRQASDLLQTIQHGYTMCKETASEQQEAKRSVGKAQMPARHDWNQPCSSVQTTYEEENTPVGRNFSLLSEQPTEHRLTSMWAKTWAHIRARGVSFNDKAMGKNRYRYSRDTGCPLLIQHSQIKLNYSWRPFYFQLLYSLLNHVHILIRFQSGWTWPVLVQVSHLDMFWRGSSCWNLQRWETPTRQANKFLEKTVANTLNE